MTDKKALPFKKLLFLTKTLCTFLIVSLLTFLNFLDLKENNQNRVYLNLLKDLTEKKRAHGLVFENYELRKVAFLDTLDPNLYLKHHTTRLIIVNILQEFGVSNTSAIKGENANFQQVGFNRFILMTDSTLTSKFKNNVYYFNQWLKDRSDERYTGTGNVNEAMQLFRSFPAQDTIELVTSIDTASLKKQLDLVLANEIKEAKRRIPDLQSAFEPITHPTPSPATLQFKPIRQDTVKRDNSGPIPVPVPGQTSTHYDSTPGDTVKRDTSHPVPQIGRKVVLVSPTKNHPSSPVQSSNHYVPGEHDLGSGGQTEESEPKGDAVLFRNYTFEGLLLYQNKLFFFYDREKHEQAEPIVVRPGQTTRTYEGYTDVDPYVVRNGSQGSPATRDTFFTVAVETTKVTLPGTLYFAGFPNDLLKDLSEKNRQDEISNLYGGAAINSVDQISADLYKKNSEPIAILGFDLSRKWFPIALCLVTMLVSLMLYLTTLKVNSAPGNIVPSADDEEVLGVLVTNRLVRFALWILTPFLIFGLIIWSSLIRYDHLVMGIMSLSCLFAMILGALAFRRSLRYL